MLFEYFEENMTYNEFKFCCIIFRKHFEGKKYGEVIENGYQMLKHSVINKSLKINGCRFCFHNEDTILYFANNLIYINRPYDFEDPFFITVKDFLNYFKIPFEDIV